MLDLRAEALDLRDRLTDITWDRDPREAAFLKGIYNTLLAILTHEFDFPEETE